MYIRVLPLYYSLVCTCVYTYVYMYVSLSLYIYIYGCPLAYHSMRRARPSRSVPARSAGRAHGAAGASAGCLNNNNNNNNDNNNHYYHDYY